GLGDRSRSMSSFSWDWAFAWEILPSLLEGLVITIQVTAIGSVLAFLIGLMWTLARIWHIPVISPVAGFAVQFIRGTPFLIQLYFLYYVAPTWGLTLSAMVTGIVGIALFNSAAVSEIYRAGIEDVPSGQWEASLTLGLPVSRVWSGIILPQAVTRILPMMGNV